MSARDSAPCDVRALLMDLEHAVEAAEQVPRTAPIALVPAVRAVVRAELELWRAMVEQIEVSNRESD